MDFVAFIVTGLLGGMFSGGLALSADTFRKSLIGAPWLVVLYLLVGVHDARALAWYGWIVVVAYGTVFASLTQLCQGWRSHQSDFQAR